MVWEFILGLFLIVLLVFFSGVVVDIFEKVSRELRLNRLLLATFLISFSTSIPELTIGLVSSFKGEPQIALGNLIGASLANLSWIVGGVALFSGAISVVGDYLRKDLWMTLLLATLPFLLMVDGSLTRLDGIVLILFYLFYVKNMLLPSEKLKHSKLNKRSRVAKAVGGRFRPWMIHCFLLALSLGALFYISSLLVGTVIKISSTLGVNSYWVGLMVLAFGTTVPELVLTLVAASRKDTSLVLGNILGSVVVNSTFILGLVSFVSPVVFESSVQKGVSGIFLVLVLGLFWLFTKTKRKLERWEGAVLIGFYLMFVGIQMLVV